MQSPLIGVIDFETTGISSAGGDRATEVAIVLTERGRVVDRFQSLMNAGVPVNSFVSQLTGITNAMVQAAPPAAEVMREAARFVGAAPLVPVAYSGSHATSGIVSDAQLIVQSAYGKREGITTINSFDDASLERVVRRSEELARLAPENPEYMPMLGPQNYAPSKTFAPATYVLHRHVQ